MMNEWQEWFRESMEKSGLTSFEAVGRQAHLSKQSVWYHYHNMSVSYFDVIGYCTIFGQYWKIDKVWEMVLRIRNS